MNVVLFASGVYREEAEHAAIFRQDAKQINTVETLYLEVHSIYVYIARIICTWPFADHIKTDVSHQSGRKQQKR